MNIFYGLQWFFVRITFSAVSKSSINMPQSLPVYGGGGEKEEKYFVNLIFKSLKYSNCKTYHQAVFQLFKSSELDQNMSEWAKCLNCKHIFAFKNVSTFQKKIDKNFIIESPSSEPDKWQVFNPFILENIFRLSMMEQRRPLAWQSMYVIVMDWKPPSWLTGP